MFDREQDNIREEFFRNYRGRYSSYWVERWGLIPELPTSFDNANSMYELLAWLQRAFKHLLDDFVALESELEDFKNAFTELLENLIPLLMRRYMASIEADEWFTDKANRYYNSVIKPYIDSEVRKLNERIDNEIQRLNNRIDREVQNLNNRIDGEVRQLNERITSEVNRLDSKIDTVRQEFERYKQDQSGKTQALETALLKLIANLESSGAWSGGLAGGLNNGRNIATGNINIFGGVVDGNSFIRTNNGQTENDLAGGI